MLLMALAPLEVELLSELEIGRIGCQQTKCIRIGFCQEDLGVDVEWVVISTRRPDERSDVEVFCDLVVLSGWTVPRGCCGDL